VALDAWNDFKEQVRQATDIVDLVGSYLQLRRQHRGYVGLCPWHDDSRPSLQVNPERQTFKCWVCDYGGDVFSFVQRIEGIDFRQSLEMLADRVGIAPPLGTNQTATSSRGADERRSLLRAMEWAVEQFHRNLLEAADARPAREYLAGRGFSAEVIDKFRLGYSPESWEWLLARARPTVFAHSVLERAGLVVRHRTEQSYHDRFRGRVIFPIHDLQGRPIALGGRVLPGVGPEKVAKYINSPETPLFSKSSQLFGLYAAREAIARHRQVVVMEGYTDCITAHQEGIENVVAVLGTALSEKHLPLLRRYADSITLVLDGDEAGRKRTDEILEIFVAAQMDLRILTLPRELDPCDFIREQGSEAFVRLLDEAVDALEHKIRAVTQGLDITTQTHQANEALENILSSVARAPRLAGSTPSAARLREEQILSRLAHQFRIPEEQLRRRVQAMRRGKQHRGGSHSAVTDAATDDCTAKQIMLDPWDCELLELILTEPTSMAKVATKIGVDQLRSPMGRRLFAKCLLLHEADEVPSFERLMLESEDAAMKNLLVQLDEQGRAKTSAEFQRILDDISASFVRHQEDAQLRTTTALLQEGQLHEQEQDTTLANLIESLRSRQAGTKPTDG